MGSVARMNMMNRAFAVLSQDPNGFTHLGRFLGGTLVSFDMDVDEMCESIEAVPVIRCRYSDGPPEAIPSTRLATLTEDGICGCSLEQRYEKEELRAMMQAALDASMTNENLSEHDRIALREELEELDTWYDDDDGR